MKDERYILFSMHLERRRCLEELELFKNRIKILSKGTNVKKITEFVKRAENIQQDINELNELIKNAELYFCERRSLGINII
jgi:hypothetical protein